MKRTICVFLLILLRGVTFAGTQADHVGTLTFLIGEVFVKRADRDWCNAEFDMALCSGDEIKTGADSRCEITLINSSVIRMDQNTAQALDKVRIDREAKDVSLFVGAGRLWLNARKIVSKQDTFKVRTDKTVCAIRGTRLGLDTNKDATRIAVHEGEVEVRAWREALRNLDAERSSEGHLEQPVPVPGPHPVTVKEWVEIIRSLQQITVDAQGHYYRSGLDLEAESRDPCLHCCL